MEEYNHIQITELTEDTLKFTLRGVDSSIANGLRRIMIAEVPSVAIRTVTIFEDTSVLVDEYIAHRLGLIPIRRISDDPTTGLKDYFECAEECERCTVTFNIDVTCRGDKPINVTSKDLKTTHPNYAPAHAASSEEARANLDNGIRIVTLAPGQTLRAECKAILGVGKEHTKWSPVGTVAMKYVPIVTINRELMDTKDSEFKQKFVDSCCRNVFAIDPITQRVTVRDAHECMFCGDCEQFNTSYADKVVTISQVPNEYEFTVESTGSVRPLEILKESIRVLEGKMVEIQRCVRDTMLVDGH